VGLAAPPARGHGQIQVITDAAQKARADVVLESKGEQRERAGQPDGHRRGARIPAAHPLRLQGAHPRRARAAAASRNPARDRPSYSESAALSKEQEALMLYQNMQSDIVQQVMRRLATRRFKQRQWPVTTAFAGMAPRPGLWNVWLLPRRDTA
jgi:LPS-assembly lipoprotein